MMSQVKRTAKAAELKKANNQKIKELIKLYHFTYHVSLRQTAKNITEIDGIKVGFSKVTNIAKEIEEAKKVEEDKND